MYMTTNHTMHIILHNNGPSYYFINIVIYDNDSVLAQDPIPITKSSNIQEPLLYTLAAFFGISIIVIMVLIVRSV